VSVIWLTALTLLPEIEKDELFVLVHPAWVASWKVADAQEPTEHVADNVASGFVDGSLNVVLDKFIAEMHEPETKVSGMYCAELTAVGEVT
jgi:hypothetical protein